MPAATPKMEAVRDCRFESTCAQTMMMSVTSTQCRHVLCLRRQVRQQLRPLLVAVRVLPVWSFSSSFRGWPRCMLGGQTTTSHFHTTHNQMRNKRTGLTFVLCITDSGTIGATWNSRSVGMLLAVVYVLCFRLILLLAGCCSWILTLGR